MNIFNEVDKFFSTLKNYFDYNKYFIVFVAIFLVALFFVIISTSHAYEVKLIKAIDMFNNYFIDNPQIDENNLIAFNNKMKSNRVPKQLRKHWQQFVLYREDKASHYMSFDNCVANPLKNSSYKRDVSLLSYVSWILAILAFTVNIFYAYEGEFADVMQHAMLCPIIIIVLDLIAKIFFEVRHNAIVSDIYQNYQYFEVNIDKATQTLPEYIDYEVLFDKKEIKRGIPILYAYLQKRAELEQKELEKARLRNLEHEKFNFDEAGVERSLVLDRAMHEAENYISERKKLLEDIEHINADLSQEEINFREVTKEYQRQMQVSKEAFDNFKAQLEEADSTIAINYLKKQQQQELNTQRDLERDYDAANEKNKQVIASYQAEIADVENNIKKLKETLEKSMMSEFNTYSEKVYNAAAKAVDEREKEKYKKIKSDMQDLEEKLVKKDNELEQVYAENGELNEKLGTISEDYQKELAEQEDILNKVSSAIESKKKKRRDDTGETIQPEEQPADEEYSEQPVDDQYAEQYDEEQPTEDGEYADDQQYADGEYEYQDENAENADYQYYDDGEYADQQGYSNEEVQPEEEQPEYAEDEQADYVEDENQPVEEEIEQPVEEQEVEQPEQEESSLGEDEEISTTTEESIVEPKRRGRPRKEVNPEETPVVKKGRGRPRKEVVENTAPVKKGRGRPRKEVSQDATPVVKKGRGRPRKEVNPEETPVVKKGRGRPRKVVVENVTPVKKGRGRPRKDENKNLDEQIKQINDEIAKENKKIEETTKKLEKKSKF